MHGDTVVTAFTLAIGKNRAKVAYFSHSARHAPHATVPEQSYNGHKTVMPQPQRPPQHRHGHPITSNRQKEREKERPRRTVRSDDQARPPLLEVNCLAPCDDATPPSLEISPLLS